MKSSILRVECPIVQIREIILPLLLSKTSRITFQSLSKNHHEKITAVSNGQLRYVRTHARRGHTITESAGRGNAGAGIYFGDERWIASQPERFQRQMGRSLFLS